MTTTSEVLCLKSWIRDFRAILHNKEQTEVKLFAHQSSSAVVCAVPHETLSHKMRQLMRSLVIWSVQSFEVFCHSRSHEVFHRLLCFQPGTNLSGADVHFFLALNQIEQVAIEIVLLDGLSMSFKAWEHEVQMTGLPTSRLLPGRVMHTTGSPWQPCNRPHRTAWSIQESNQCGMACDTYLRHKGTWLPVWYLKRSIRWFEILSYKGTWRWDVDGSASRQLENPRTDPDEIPMRTVQSKSYFSGQFSPFHSWIWSYVSYSLCFSCLCTMGMASVPNFDRT